MICVGLDLKFWPDVKGAVQDALDGNGGRICSDELLKLIKENKAQLWGLHDGVLRAVMVTEIINYPQLKAIRIIAVGGRDMDMWLDTLIDTIGRWGAGQGAHVMEFVGRRGWEKKLTSKGFGELQIFMTRRI